MADVTSIKKYTFGGYDNKLFRLVNTLAQILEQLSIEKVVTFTDSTSSSEIGRVNSDFEVNSISGSGAIPFIYVTKTTVDGVNYLKRLDFVVSVGNNSVSWNWTQEYGRANSTTTSTSTFTNNNLTQMNTNLGSHATDAYYVGDSVSWASGLINFPAEIKTNIPIFLCADDFVFADESQAIKDAINGFMTHSTLPESIIDGERVLEILNGEEGAAEEIYEFSTIARNYTVDEYGNMTENEEEGERYRGLRIKIKGLASLYKIPGISDGVLKYGINLSTTPVICYYSDDYGNTWKNVPGQPTTLPFDYVYRPYEEDDGEGTFWAAVGDGDNKNLLIFDNEEDSDEYNSGESDGRKASNYNEINSGGFNNPTGEEDEGTDFGEVRTKGFFSQQYIMDSGSLQALADDLFDTSVGGIWEAIKKGLDMYGDNPIEAVMGLSFWPLNLNEIFNAGSATHVWFGGYGWEVRGGGCNKIVFPNGYKTLGSLTISRTFRNWRDYSPYSRLYVSLPYVGVYELDLTRYYDKTVEVRYYFDTRTNGCIACLIADGHLMDYFNGQMGVTMPITLTDYAGYANSQIATLLGAGALAAGTAGVMAAGVVGLGGAAAGLAGTAVGASGMAGAAAAAGAGLNAAGAAGIMAGAPIAGAALGAKTVYGLSQNNINKHNVTKGGSSSMINEYLPQYVEFIFEIQEDCAPDNYGAQYGYPSMKSGSVGSFQGFLKCQSVKLDCGVATENEKNQIKTMLLNGIYI